MVYEDKEDMAPDRDPISQFDPKKFSRQMKEFGAAAMDPKYDKGKYRVKEVLDELWEKINACAHTLDQIKTYPIDPQLPMLDPVVEVDRLGNTLDKLQKRLTMLHVQEQILQSKQNTSRLEEQFKKLQGKVPQ
jgi:hypothetical protein